MHQQVIKATCPYCRAPLQEMEGRKESSSDQVKVLVILSSSGNERKDFVNVLAR